MISGASGAVRGVVEVWIEAINGWKAWRHSAGLNPYNTQLGADRIVMLAEHYIPRSPWSLETNDLSNFMALHPEWGKGTLYSYRTTFINFYKWALLNNYVEINPAQFLGSVKVPRNLPRPCPDGIFYSTYERSDQRTRLALVLMRMGGLRRAECAKLHEDDRISWNELIIKGKGGKQRIIPLHEIAAQELDAEIKRRKDGHCGTGFRYTYHALNGGWIFPGRDGHISPRSLGDAVSKAFGRNDWTAHNLRHAIGTQLLDETGDLALVQDFLGHASPDTTRIYAMVKQERINTAVTALKFKAMPCSTNGNRAGED